jgi:hypothetical protein
MTQARTLADFVSGTTTITGNPTFSGTVAGAGGMVLLNTYTVSSASVTEIIWNNTYFNSTYDKYLLQGRWGFDTDNIKTYAQFYQSDGTTLINGSGDYGRSGSTVYAGSYTAQDHLFLSPGMGSTYTTKLFESGAHGTFWIYSRCLNSGDIKPDMIGFTSIANATAEADTRFMGGRLGKVAGTIPTSAFQIGGLKIYPHATANFLQNSTFSLFGLAK